MKALGNSSFTFSVVFTLSCLYFCRTRVAQWVRELDYLTTHTSLSPIRRWFATGLEITRKGALNSQPQVIKFTSCLPMVGGSILRRLCLIGSTIKLHHLIKQEPVNLICSSIDISINVNYDAHAYWSIYFFLISILSFVSPSRFTLWNALPLRWVGPIAFTFARMIVLPFAM